jgi:hypothetical protein
MKDRLFKKVLVIGIIILFVGVSVLSSVSSKDVSVSKDRIFDDNNEIETSDDYSEIFTYINGYCDYIKAKRIGILVHFNVELWADPWGLTISGIKKPFNRFEEDVYEVIVPCFIGFIDTSGSP